MQVTSEDVWTKLRTMYDLAAVDDREEVGWGREVGGGAGTGIRTERTWCMNKKPAGDSLPLGGERVQAAQERILFSGGRETERGGYFLTTKKTCYFCPQTRFSF